LVEAAIAWRGLWQVGEARLTWAPARSTDPVRWFHRDIQGE